MPSGFCCAAWGREAGAGEGRGPRGFRVKSAGARCDGAKTNSAR